MTHIPGHYIPENPLGAFQATFGSSPFGHSTGSLWGDIKAAPGVDLVPGLSTAANWEEMGPVGRSFSTGLDAIDLLTMGLGKFGTAPVRSLLPKVTGAFNRFIKSDPVMHGVSQQTLRNYYEKMASPVFSQVTKDGKNTFQILERDTRGMYGPQDKYKLVVVDNMGNVVKDWGSHPSLEGAKKMAGNQGIIDPPIDTYEEMVRRAELAAEGRIAKNVEGVSPSTLTYDIFTGTRSEGVSPGQMLGGYGEAMGEIYGTTPIFPFSTPSGIIPLSAGAPFERRILDAFEGVSSSPRYGSETFSVPANPFSYSPKLPFLDITKGFMGAQDVVPQDIRKLPNMSIAYPQQQTARSSADIARELAEIRDTYTASLRSRWPGLPETFSPVWPMKYPPAQSRLSQVPPLGPSIPSTHMSLPFTIPARGVLNYDPRNDVRLPFRGGADTGG